MLRLRRRYSIHPTPAPSSTARDARIGRDRSERLWRQAYGHRLGQWAFGPSGLRAFGPRRIARCMQSDAHNQEAIIMAHWSGLRV
jgi:hypothetical protein